MLMAMGRGIVRRAVARRLVPLMALLLATTVLVIPAGADSRPKIIPLPDGWQPEGIATSGGNTFYAGSLATGAVFKGSLRTGEGDPDFVEGREGRVAVGMKVDRGVLWVAGGPTGQAYAYDARTGEELAVFDLVSGSTFVNDVIVTRTAAWFTDSFNQQLYKVPIRNHGFGEPQTVPLIGDIEFVAGEFNANGIDATSNGKRLIVVQSNTGQLFEVSPRSGVASVIDLGGESVPSGDGILLDGGHRLWVVQNSINTLTLVDLDSHLESGEVVSRTTDDDFDVPTTVAESGNRLALANARFGVPEPEDAEYWVTQIEKPKH
jgi:hypothetical protein